MSAGFDPTAFKAQQKQNWNNLSSGWDRWYELFESGAAPVTRTLLERAGVDEGHRVLDIGSGTGQPALTVAEVVGSKGSVVGVDQAGDMLEIARRRAAELDLANTEFLEQDAESLGFEDASFDAVVSRFTLMFLPGVDGVLRTAHRLLRPGGALTASVWGPPPAVPILSQAFGIVAARLELPPPPPGVPGPFSMADPEALTERLRRPASRRPRMRSSGWPSLPRRPRSSRSSRGSCSPAAARPARRQDRRGTRPGDVGRDLDAAREFETGDGFRVPALGHCVKAVKSH